MLREERRAPTAAQGHWNAAAPRTARFQRQTELRWEGACHATRLKEGCVREYALRFRECTKHMSMTENITFKKKKKSWEKVYYVRWPKRRASILSPTLAFNKWEEDDENIQRLQRNGLKKKKKGSVWGKQSTEHIHQTLRPSKNPNKTMVKESF